MNAADALATFAAVSVGVSGFSAIVVAVAARSVIYDDRRLQWAMGLIFAWALGALYFSILPFILFHFGVYESAIWRPGLVVMSAYVTVVGAVALAIDRRFNRSGLDMKGIQHEGPAKRSPQMRVAAVIYVGTAALALIAAVRFPNPGFYLVGMIIMLTLSLWTLLTVFFLVGLMDRRPGSRR